MTNPLKPLFSGATPQQISKDIASLVAFQKDGVETAVLQQMLHEKLTPHLMDYSLPEFQSMFNTFLSDQARLGATFAIHYNQGITNWQVSPGGAILELLCTKALCQLFGLGDEADATFMYAGTYANEQAVYLALHRHAENAGFDFAKEGVAGFKNHLPPALLVSADTHFSINHAVRTVGLGENNLFKIPVNQNRQVDLDALNTLVRKIQKTHQIFCIVATAGTTSAGAIDPLKEIGKLCRSLNCWFHIDGAYGYAYKLVPEWKDRYLGDELADSITWDPHKQIGAPIPNSILFVKDWRDFGRISLYGAYFNRKEDVGPNPGLKSPPSTRSFAALPLVTLLRGQGLRQIIDDLRVPLTAVQQLYDYLQTQPDIKVCHKPDLGILCFRMEPSTYPSEKWDILQSELYEKIMQSGQRSISLTKLDGVPVLRVVSVSPSTTFNDYLDTINHLRDIIEEKTNG
ncbi:MAG: aminotransferase class V-fold PLP-dependent enzyme [Chloroflexota bacterium]